MHAGVLHFLSHVKHCGVSCRHNARRSHDEYIFYRRLEELLSLLNVRAIHVNLRALCKACHCVIED